MSYVGGLDDTTRISYSTYSDPEFAHTQYIQVDIYINYIMLDAIDGSIVRTDIDFAKQIIVYYNVKS